MPDVLLVGTTVASWDDPICALLIGHRVVRYDLRDTGRAVVVDPDSPGYMLRDLVADAAGRPDGRAHVVGLGVGGWIAQLLALDRPAVVATLTLIGTRPTAPGPDDPDLPEHADEVMAYLMDAAEPDWTDRAAVLDHMTEYHRRPAGGARFDADDARARAGRVFDRAAGGGATREPVRDDVRRPGLPPPVARTARRDHGARTHPPGGRGGRPGTHPEKLPAMMSRPVGRLRPRVGGGHRAARHEGDPA